MPTPMSSILVLALLQAESSEPPAPPVVPAATDEQLQARQLLEDFQSRLYDPIAEGLESLAFDVLLPPTQHAQDGSRSVLHVSWLAGRGTVSDLDLAELDRPSPPWIRALAEGLLQELFQETGRAERIVALQTNSMLREVLATSEPQLQGLQGSLVRVVCRPLPGTPGGVVNRVLRLDEQGQVVESVLVTETTMLGRTDRTRTESALTWVELPQAGGKLVLGAVTHTPAGADRTDWRFELVREDVGGFQLVTRMRGWPDEPSTMFPEGLDVAFENFIVNGKAIEGR